tara:strand:+ start:341 stop:613 length:273 start_codon:yes stop_codon:yes gene_type:complete
MPLTKVDRLTTTTGNTFANLAEWKAEHGNCGTASPTVESATLVVEEGGATALRTLTFTDAADITSFKEEVAARDGTRNWTTVNISKDAIE